MNFDVITIAALVDELLDTIVGGRIQNVIDTDETGIGLEIYSHHKRHYLYLSGDQQFARAHLVSYKLRRGLATPTQLGLLLRTRVKGGRITHVSQPKWERIIEIDLESGEDEFKLVLELMGRRSNLLFLQDNMILDCIRRIGPEQNRYRLSLPNHAYVPPPPMTDKLDPRDLTPEKLQAILDEIDKPDTRLDRVLPSKVYGFSPMLIREMLFRVGLSPETSVKDITEVVAEQLTHEIGRIVEDFYQHRWQPGIAKVESSIEAFSAYPLHHLGEWQSTSTLSEAIELYFHEITGAEAYQEAKIPVFSAIQEAITKVTAKLTSLEKSLTDDAEREKLRQAGELIYAYQYQIMPDQTELAVQYAPDSPEMIIKLNPDLSASENAQQYFERYQKAKRALQEVPELIEESKVELAFLHQLESDLNQAQNWQDVNEVMYELQSAGYTPPKSKVPVQSGRSAPMKLVHDGYVIWVGRNSHQNELVTFKKANAQDLWLHARDVPGSHVVIRNDGRRIPQGLIDQVASIAAYYSARRNDTNVPVDVTRVKYVRKIKGAGAGMVTYRNETTLTVEPHNEEIFVNE